MICLDASISNAGPIRNKQEQSRMSLSIHLRKMSSQTSYPEVPAPVLPLRNRIRPSRTSPQPVVKIFLALTESLIEPISAPNRLVHSGASRRDTQTRPPFARFIAPFICSTHHKSHTSHRPRCTLLIFTCSSSMTVRLLK